MSGNNKFICCFVHLIKLGQEYIRKNIIWDVKITDTREEIPEIPLDSIREAIINSFVHKSYKDPKGVEISIFKDRVEIYNPGTFPDEYEPTDYINDNAHSVLRNPLIANILYKSSDIESYSSGIKRMYDECNRNGVKISFRKEKIGFVVIFDRKSKILADTANENDTLNDTLNNYQIKILKEITKNNKITQNELSEIIGVSIITIKREIGKLQKIGALKREGSRKSGIWKIAKKK